MGAAYPSKQMAQQCGWGGLTGFQSGRPVSAFPGEWESSLYKSKSKTVSTVTGEGVIKRKQSDLFFWSNPWSYSII